MNGVSGAGSAQQSLMMQLLQQQQGGLSGGGFQGPPPEIQAQFQSAAESLGIDGSQLASLRGEIETAVQDAMKSFDGSGSPKEAISSAINGVLEENGIDAEEFKAQMQDIMSASGFQPPAGFGSGFGGGFGQIQGASFDATSQQADLLSQIFGDSDDTDSAESSQSSSFNIADYFRQLPAGSLLNTSA